MFGSKRRHRERLRAEPFPPEWRRIVERNVPLYGRLPDAQRRALDGHIQVFLDEKNFEGVGGLAMTDEIRLTIAAQACLLLLGRDPEAEPYPDLRSVVVYPSAYVAEGIQSVEGGIVTEGPQARLGESWHHGAVVLSWDDVRSGARDADDGHNVVFHEFAHQLDQESGEVDGVPALDRSSSIRAWARILGGEFRDLQAAGEEGRKDVLDPYGATHPAEFFAVATESFFETPGRLRASHPELFGALREFYGVDPVDWLERDD